MPMKTANRRCATQRGTGLPVSPKMEPEVVITVPVYKMGGDTTVTENVTWLSPVACDLGKQAAESSADMRRAHEAAGRRCGFW